MPALLTEQDYKDAAKLLKADVAAVKAVAEVESAGSGFLANGKLKILFEGHQFHKFTHGAHAQTDPDICYPKWTKQFYAKGPDATARGMGELARLERAKKLNKTAALLSASYGKFQIMGFNFAHCGFTKVEDFVAALEQGEREQLAAFCAYLADVGLADELRSHRWSDFARLYNGPLYGQNKYDVKLAAAWARHA